MCKYLISIALTLLVAAQSLPTLAKPAVDFQLPTTDSEISLNQYKGKIVYLDFWASWCSPCVDSFPWMEEMQKKYRDMGVVFLAVNLDKERKDADRFLLANPVGFTVAFDREGYIAKNYELIGMPSAFVIDREGMIRHTHIGFNKRDKAEYELHIQNLLDTTQEL